MRVAQREFGQLEKSLLRAEAASLELCGVCYLDGKKVKAFQPREGRLLPDGFLAKGYRKRGIPSTMLQLKEYWWKAT